jgi:hypothetical protein
MTTRVRTILPLTPSVMLVFAACGGDDDSDSGSDGDTTTTSNDEATTTRGETSTTTATAGYGPNETSVVANIPCTVGEATEGSVQLRGCSESDACAESERQSVQISG